jgi:hypothetical protein
MGKYYRIKKKYAQRAGLNEILRTADGDDLLLSEKDVRMISLTIEEMVAALGGSEYEEIETPEESGNTENVESEITE